MKNYVKNALIGFMIGLLLIPITFVELYYAGGIEMYLKEVVNFENYMCISVIVPIYSTLIGLALTAFVNIVSTLKDKEWNLKSSIRVSFRLIIALLAAVLAVYLVSQLFINKVSESVQALINANSIISMFSILTVHAIEEGKEIRKINKKLKENK